MTKHTRLLTALSTALVLGVAGTASAASLSFNLTGASSGTAAYGNTETFTNNGVTVTASAWGYTFGAGDSALEKAWLGKYSPGLGVCDQNEGLNCSSPSHTVDSFGTANYVLFTFSEAIDVTTVTLNAFSTLDSDVSYYVGNITLPPNLNGVTYAGLAGLGFTGSYQDAGAPAASRTVNINQGTQYINALLIGAMIPNDATKDYFKIATLTGTTKPVCTPGTPGCGGSTVPEPGTMLLLGSGLVGLVARQIKKRKA